MDWNWYLFSFEGRINRAKLWLSLFVLLGWMLFSAWTAYFAALLAILRYPHFHGTLDVSIGIDEIVVLLGRAIHMSLSLLDAVSLAANLFGMTVFMWIWLATSIKRLHDRDMSGWWMVLFFAVPGVYFQFADLLPDSYLVLFITWPITACYLWGIAELYFRPGTRWPNRFGPNPLGKQQMRPRSGGLLATSAWKPRDEIEMTPHLGSPPPGMRVNRGA